MALTEAKRNTLELSRELKILERNIHLFTQRLLDEANTAAAVLAEGIDRYEHAVLANYHRLKTIDNVYRQRSAILERLVVIEQDEQALQLAAGWYAAQSRSPLEGSKAAVAADLQLLRSHFDAIPDLVAEIDARNARFSELHCESCAICFARTGKTETQLEFIVGALARGEAPEIEFDVFRCELLADGFLYTPPTKRPKPLPQALAAPSGIDRAEVYKEAAARVRRLFARRRIEEFASQFLGGRSSASLDELTMEGDQDYIRLLYLVGYGLDGTSSFTFVPEAGRLEKAAYGYPAGRIARGRKRNGRGGNSPDGNAWTSSKTIQS